MEYNNGTIITLDNLEKYIIFSQVTYNDIKYYYVLGYDEIKQDINGTCKIIKINKNENDNYIELVNDMQELANVIPLFKEFYE